MSVAFFCARTQRRSRKAEVSISADDQFKTDVSFEVVSLNLEVCYSIRERVEFTRKSVFEPNP